MPGRLGICVLAVIVAGCHVSPGTRPPSPGPASATPSEPTAPAKPAVELPLTEPLVPVLDARELPPTPPHSISRPEGTFRRLTEPDCLTLAAANTTAARLLEEEDRVPAKPAGSHARSDRSSSQAQAQLRSSLRFHTALELRNWAAGESLERFFQLVEVEARADLLRQAFPIIEEQIAKARAARTANMRFPFEAADLERERSQLESQLRQVELASQLLNLDLKRRLGLPEAPAGDGLWPVGDFAIDPNPFDPEAAVVAAMADRPELRGLRRLQQDLTVETLPEARSLMLAASPQLGQAAAMPQPGLFVLLLEWCRLKKASPETGREELAVRKQQLQELIAEREQDVAAEARAAAMTANAQRLRAGLARDRLAGWEEKLKEAERKLAAKQPGAEFQVPQLRLEVLKARGELAAEVAAWHQARVKLRAAEGWLGWEAMSKEGK